MNRAQRLTTGVGLTAAAALSLGALWSYRGALLERYLLWELERAEEPSAALVHRLVELGSPEVLPHLLQTFEHDLTERRGAWSERRFLVGNINFTIREPSDRVWETLVSGHQLVRFADLAAPGLVGLLSEEEPRVRSGASRALHEIGRPAASALIEALGASDARVTLRAAHLLARLDPPEASAIPGLLRLARTGSVGERRTAVLALGLATCGSGAEATAIRALCGDSDRGVRDLAQLASARTRALTSTDASALDRLHARMLHFHREPRTETSRMYTYLLGQFHSAQRYINPHLDPTFEGEIFVRLFSGGVSRAPAHARAWGVLLEELGCTVTATGFEALERISTTYLQRVREEAHYYSEDDHEGLGHAARDIFLSYCRDMRRLLGDRDFRRLARLFEETNLHVAAASGEREAG